MGRRFESLDGLRGLAAFAVLGHHIVITQRESGWLDHAHLAVDFFFQLSGFVIGSAYEGRLRAGLGLWPYMRIRLARLYPMIAAGVLVGFAVQTGLHPDFNIWLALAGQLTLVPFVATLESPYPLNTAHWSLFFELLANLAHALVAPVLSTRALAASVLVSAVGLVALGYFAGSLNVGYLGRNFLAAAPRVSFPFLAGLLIFRLKAAGRLRLPPVPYAVGIAALAVVLIVPKVAPRYADAALVILVFPAILVGVVEAGVPRALAGLSRWSGRLSYPLYAIHAPLMVGAAAMATHIPSTFGQAVLWAGAAVGAVGLAELLQRTVDVRGQALLLNRAGTQP